MSHILRRDSHEVCTTRPYAAVRVEVVSLRPCVLQVTGDVFLLKRGARLAKLPIDVLVVSDNTHIKASGEFYISTETCNPYHALTDVLDESLFHQELSIRMRRCGCGVQRSKRLRCAKLVSIAKHS